MVAYRMNSKAIAIVVNGGKVSFGCGKKFPYLGNPEAFLSKVLDFAPGKKKPRIGASLKPCPYIRPESVTPSQSDGMPLVIGRGRGC